MESRGHWYERARSQFRNNPILHNNIEVTDEIWFFYDVEAEDMEKWEQRLKIIKHLRKLRRKPGIRVRLLMTSGCIEYWLMLHYEYCTPALENRAQKEKMMAALRKYEPHYQKGDVEITNRIAENYPTAVANGQRTLARLAGQGLPAPDDDNLDKRDEWLSKNRVTFTTVHEAIEYLESL